MSSCAYPNQRRRRRASAPTTSASPAKPVSPFELCALPTEHEMPPPATLPSSSSGAPPASFAGKPESFNVTPESLVGTPESFVGTPESPVIPPSPPSGFGLHVPATVSQ